jgi:hypothetical protein
MTRNAEVFLAGVCAKHLTDKLALAGFVLNMQAQPRAPSGLAGMSSWPRNVGPSNWP